MKNVRTQTRLLMIPAALALALQGAGQTAAPQPSSAAAVPAYRQANHVALLSVDGVVDKVTLASLERRMERAVSDGADAIVIELNTPGGDMFATLDICNLLKDRSDTPANTVAWIRPHAYSAGTLIALACREIVVAPGSTFGVAAPIMVTPFGGLQGLPPTERAKLVSPLKTELVDSARRHHYDEKLVQAFVELSDLWMLENVNTGERIFVDRAEYRVVFGEDPPEKHSAGAIPPAAAPPVPWADTSVPRTSDAAGLNPQQRDRMKEFHQSLPPTRDALTEADRGQWRLIMQVADDNSPQLLTLKPDYAIYYGLAAAVIANETELQAFFGAQSLRRYDQTWSESLVRFLTSFWVRGLLLVIFVLALFLELATPGMGVFGATAIAALLILVGAPALAGMAQWWDILLIVAGLFLVAVELFLLPGFGFPGVLGILSLLVGLVGTFVSGDVTHAAGQAELWTGLLTTVVALFVAGMLIWFLSRNIHASPWLNWIVLKTELKDDDAQPLGLLQAMGPGARALQVGDVGAAETDLRPAGRAKFDDRLHDVKSVGGYIERGTPVRVVSVGRFVIEVDECES